MDTLAEIIAPRILDIRVHDADKERMKNRRVLHPMLTGIYRPLAVKHEISPQGYFTELTCLRVVGSASDSLVETYTKPTDYPSQEELDANKAQRKLETLDRTDKA